MTRLKDIKGLVFNKWTVLERDFDNTEHGAFWICRCECGTIKSVYGSYLIHNRSTMCRKCTGRKHKNVLNARIWGRINHRAKKHGIEIDLGQRLEAKKFLYDLLYIKQNCRCVLSGLPISIADTIHGDMVGESTASLDRIDSSRGYTRDNVQWVHKDINKLKMDFNQSRFIILCKLVASHQEANGR